MLIKLVEFILLTSHSLPEIFVIRGKPPDETTFTFWGSEGCHSYIESGDDEDECEEEDRGPLEVRS